MPYQRASQARPARRPRLLRLSIRPAGAEWRCFWRPSGCRCAQPRSARPQGVPLARMAACRGSLAIAPKKPKRKEAPAARRWRPASSIPEPPESPASTSPPPQRDAKESRAERQNDLDRDESVAHLGARQHDFRQAVSPWREIRRRVVLSEPAHDRDRQLAIGNIGEIFVGREFAGSRYHQPKVLVKIGRASCRERV